MAEAHNARSAFTPISKPYREVEAPLSLNLLARRIAPYWSFQKSSAKLRSRVLEVLEKPHADVKFMLDEDMTYVYLSEAPPHALSFYRVPTSDQRSRRHPEDIALPEVRNASQQYRRLALPEEEFHRRTADVLGYSRLGENVRRRMKLALGER